MIDPSGIYGSLLSYSLTIVFAGGAFLIFLYLWSKGRLGLDEEAKDQMMKQQEEFHE
jgi:hypothetical protein